MVIIADRGSWVVKSKYESDGIIVEFLNCRIVELLMGEALPGGASTY
jgi:hypothetical protein